MVSHAKIAACPRPFGVGASGSGALSSTLLRLARRPLEAVLRCNELNDVYEDVWRRNGTEPFSQRVLDALHVDVNVPERELARIPATGPLLVVANHPFGGIDGLVLMALLGRIRPDVRLVMNRFLRTIPELRDQSFMVDAFGGADAARRNVGPLRKAFRWVKDGGALAVFPAGEVSSLRLDSRTVADRDWSPAIGRIALLTGAPVLSVFFEGRNSDVFHLAGLVHPRLRTLMLPRELLARRHSRVHVHVGSLIRTERVRKFTNAEDLTAYLRVRTYLLKGRSSACQPCQIERRPGPPEEPVAAAEPPEQVRTEVESLPAERCLARTGALYVTHATAAEIPTLLREIGRLREISFRGVGEGTGRSRDLDRFDEHYTHLFVWDAVHGRVVGAYRMGFVSHILREHGPAGLYTSTLFHYRGTLLERLGDAIELGRSFVRPECRKDVAPLALLWKGLARTAAINPRYKRLFGPVSISDRYTSMSKRLLVAFLRMSHIASDLSELIQGKNPPRLLRDAEIDPRLTGMLVRDVDEVDELLSEIERERLKTPVLLRQYLKLNAKLLGFNVDPQFGDVLDALMIVDLTKVQRAILYRYMGAEMAQSFLAYHGITG